MTELAMDTVQDFPTVTEFRGDHAAGGVHWADMRPDPAVAGIQGALDAGQLAAARMRFLKLTERAQAEVLQALDPDTLARLADRLPSHGLAQACEHLAESERRDVLGALPGGKRHGVRVILDHRARLA
ncbi:magnesium transporter MgtE N-terminal domain-containing protein [Thioalkalivibrio sp. ALE11]|uniref:magnesium transporter MgtE N-terminal domain-containing protein n=1 Tax=Thioalkalivibrio sp. ALE11 TaxID=1265494 RepID=UPI00036D0907|nr:hypothetical protein [Thioalkalivibrio sp. ALE11]